MSNSEATKLRQQENEEYVKSSTDYKESAHAVVQAISVLKEFYKGESALLQQPNFAKNRGDAGHAIIEILETAESDFTRLLAETEANESESLEAYKKLMQ